MNDETHVILVVIIICLLIGFGEPIITCHSKAAALGYKCSYGLFSGCVLEKADGKKVLLEQLRDFDN